MAPRHTQIFYHIFFNPCLRALLAWDEHSSKELQCRNFPCTFLEYEYRTVRYLPTLKVPGES